jgi:DnaK suppressor protein
MDPDHARGLLQRERARIERAIADLGVRDGETPDDPGDRGSENLYQAEFDAGLSEELAAQLQALERAEARLAAGTYGLSIESGEPIPDARLEAVPTSERTVEEQERLEQA